MACLEVYVVNNPCWLDCYIGTCSKKNQSELLFKSKRCSAPHLKNWQLQLRELANVAHEGETRRSSLLCLAVFLSFTKKANCERSGLGG